jgi:hypothetical protein
MCSQFLIHILYGDAANLNPERRRSSPPQKVISHYTCYYTAYRESTGTSREGLDMDLSSAPCPLSALLRPVREK